MTIQGKKVPDRVIKNLHSGDSWKKEHSLSKRLWWKLSPGRTGREDRPEGPSCIESRGWVMGLTYWGTAQCTTFSWGLWDFEHYCLSP